MRMKNWSLLLLFLGFATFAMAQGSAFGAKGGLTMGFQTWNDFKQQPLFRYHGIVFMESLGDNALFLQAGYHIKGSALRNRRFFNPINMNQYNAPAQNFQFRNISLTLGAKKKRDIGRGDAQAYYMLGVRGDYTVNTNLSEYEDPLFIFSTFPTDQWVRKFNYGVTIGGGFEFPFSNLIGGILEFTLNPDLSRQYNQPALANVYDPYTGTDRSVPERRIINITLEVSLGIRFLKIVEYID
jgi:hypothetical protein